MLSEKAQKAFLAAVKAGTSFDESEKPHSHVAYLTEEGMKPSTVLGRNNILKLALAMRADYEKRFQKVLDKNGQIKVMTPEKTWVRVSWDELTSRLPSYFLSTFSKANLTKSQKTIP